MLGTKLSDDDLVCTILHPISKKEIIVMLDPCHMLKLLRNVLTEKGPLIDMDGNEINWLYISKLVDKQEKEGLHMATKVRRKHVDFQNEKMKVRLAAQVFSRSVADALNTLQYDLEDDEFEGAHATARFCRQINDIFDVLNSRKRCNGTLTDKNAITIENIEEVKVIAAAHEQYLRGLRLKGIPVIDTSRKTDFLGFIICLRGVIKVAEYLFAGNRMTYLLTYKLSQDHLETFFSCIRRCGGFNNNPAVRQFKSAYKKLLIHANVYIPLTGNCQAKDESSVLSKNYIPASYDDSTFHTAITDDTHKVFHETNCNVQHCSTIFNEYIDDVISYISGSVVRSIARKVKCNVCLQALKASTDEEPHSMLQVRKCRGGFISASKDTILICKAAESIVRQFKNKLHF